MERALGLDVAQWRSPPSAPRRTPGSTRASPCPPWSTGHGRPRQGLDVLAAALRQSPAFSVVRPGHRGAPCRRDRIAGTGGRVGASPALSFSRRARAGRDGDRLDLLPPPAGLATGRPVSPCPRRPTRRRSPRHVHVVQAGALRQSPASPWCRADHGGGHYRELGDHDGRSNMQHPLIWRSRAAWVRRDGLAASMRPSRQLPASGHCWTFGAPNVCSDLADAGRIGRSCP
jgi:hypothetical protein